MKSNVIYHQSGFTCSLKFNKPQSTAQIVSKSPLSRPVNPEHNLEQGWSLLVASGLVARPACWISEHLCVELVPQWRAFPVHCLRRFYLELSLRYSVRSQVPWNSLYFPTQIRLLSASSFFCSYHLLSCCVSILVTRLISCFILGHHISSRHSW